MSPNTAATADVNPAITTWTGPFGLPQFGSINDRDFEVAFVTAFPAHLVEIESIAENPDEPTFENTIVAMETAGTLLNKASSIFWNLAGTDSNETLQELERELSPALSRHYSAISMNRALFDRIDTLYQKRESLGLHAEACRAGEDVALRRVYGRPLTCG